MNYLSPTQFDLTKENNYNIRTYKIKSLWYNDIDIVVIKKQEVLI